MAQVIRIVAMVASLVVAAAGAQAHSLADTMVLAYRHSGVLDQNRALLRAADEDVAQAVASMRPIINWAATASYQYKEVGATSFTPARVQEGAVVSLEMTAGLTLYDFGRGRLAVAAARENVMATRQALISAEQSILLQAVQAHLGVQRAVETLELRRSNLRLITRELRAAEDRLELGETTRTEIDSAKARQASARAQLAAAEADLASAREIYKAVTGEYPGPLRAAPPARISQSMAEAKAYALRYHPSAVQQRHTVAAAELNVQRAEAAKMPTLTLGGSIAVDEEFNRTNGVQLKFGGPLYQGGALSSQVRQAMARRDAARAGLHQVSTQIEQQVGTAYASYRVTDDILSAAARQVTAARSAYRGLQDEAGLGARTTLDILGGEQRLLDAQVGQIGARIDRVLASYNVLAATGVLTARGLNLPVQQYDPEAYYRIARQAPMAGSAQGRALDRVLESIGQ